MRCPYCQHHDSKVLDTSHDSHGGIRRRRECFKCGQRFSTYERPILATPLTTLTAFASASLSADDPSTTDADNGEVRFELARGFDFWRSPDGGSPRGQLFLRYANQSSSLRQFSLEAPTVPAVRTVRATWTLSSGASLRLF